MSCKAGRTLEGQTNICQQYGGTFRVGSPWLMIEPGSLAINAQMKCSRISLCSLADQSMSQRAVHVAAPSLARYSGSGQVVLISGVVSGEKKTTLPCPCSSPDPTFLPPRVCKRGLLLKCFVLCISKESCCFPVVLHLLAGLEEPAG